jgi:hypothetical protein
MAVTDAAVLFQACRKRIERATAYSKELSDSWGAIANEHFYRITANVDTDGSGAIKATRVNPIPPDFMFKLGELFYQLRASLDSAVYASAVLESGCEPPPKHESLAFPIVLDPLKYPKKQARELGDLSNERRRIVQSIQPFVVDDPVMPQLAFERRALGILNRWARVDRHRRLHVVGSWVGRFAPKFRLPEGVEVQSFRAIESGFLEDVSILATFVLSNWNPAHAKHVYTNPNLKIEIALDEKPTPASPEDSFGNRLRAMMIVCHRIVDSMERGEFVR